MQGGGVQSGRLTGGGGGRRGAVTEDGVTDREPCRERESKEKQKKD